jgi:hypothetical protein
LREPHFVQSTVGDAGGDAVQSMWRDLNRRTEFACVSVCAACQSPPVVKGAEK